MKNLDKFIDAYKDNFEFAFDNQIILNWYPQQILAKSPRSARVLELGIGHGYTCNWFSNYYDSYSVVDASSEVIKKYKKEFPTSRARIVESLFETFETSEQFDCVIMGFVLEHVEDPKHILTHYKKMLKPDGRCFVAVPNAECLHRRIGKAGGCLNDLFSLGRGDLALGHRRLYSVKSLTKEMEDCGYRILKKEGIFLKPLTTQQLKGLNLNSEIIQGMCQVGVNYPELSAAILFEAACQ